jgi:hypothetical protein
MRTKKENKLVSHSTGKGIRKLDHQSIGLVINMTKSVKLDIRILETWY